MTTPLRLVKPMAVSGAMLTATNVPENDYAEWNAATAYAAGARVIRADTHRIYQRIVAGTTAAAPEGDPANWIELGATNRWRMFDRIVSSQTRLETGAEMTFALAPGRVFNAVALLNVVAAAIRIRVVDAVDGVVYDRTTPLSAPLSAVSYWAYFFDAPTLKTKHVAIDLPSYGKNATVEITLEPAAGVAACGVCVIGTVRQIGHLGIRSGAQIGITDYSHKEKNEFGELQLIERAWSDRLSFSLLVPNRQLDAVKTLFADLRATPVLWIASGDYESLAVYGIYKDFAAVIAYPDFSEMNIELEGLV